VAAERWIEISVRVSPDDVDPVSTVLADLTGQAVAIQPEIRRIETEDFGYEELDRPVTVNAYAAAPLGDAARAEIEAALGALRLETPIEPPSYRELDPADWAEEWKRFYEIQHIGDRLVIRPTWLEYDPQPGELVIDLDPGAAFGTGQHETTRLCLAAIEAQLVPGAEAIDVGCGSGILAIAAAKLGAGRVLALDVDPEAVRVTEENATANDVAGLIEAAAGSLDETWPWGELPKGSAGLVVANISSAIVTRLLAAIGGALTADGRAVLSGFLERDAGMIEERVAAAGMAVLDRSSEGEWACLVAGPAGDPSDG
jgi:ribosomal protein L11 methyltransferase